VNRLLFKFVFFIAALAVTDAESDSLRSAKALFFDHKYAESRAAWQAILGTGRGADGDAAAYWIARCSEGLGENERALDEYSAFLDRRPADAALAEEARTSRVGLAVKLFKDGRSQHIHFATEALKDRSSTVRYYAALQVGGLGGDVGHQAVPALKEILAQASDPDLVNRAKLALLRLEPAALEAAGGGAEPPRGKPATWLKVRVTKLGASKPEVVVNVPVALAELVFKGLPDDAKSELKKKGYDADNFWERLKRMGPTEIIDIQGEDGERVQIWLE
jgi:hypothetical protein